MNSETLPPALRGRLLCALLWLTLVPASAQIWTEDFNSYPDGTTNAPPKWTSNATDCDDPSPNQGPNQSQWGVYGGQFTVNDIEGAPCCANGGGGGNNFWLSELINIAGYCNVSITITVSAAGGLECDDSANPIFGCTGNTPPDNSHDQVVLDYSLDAGAFTQFGYVCGASGVGTFNVTGLSGNTLQIRVRASNKANSEFYFFDNVLVDGSTPATPTFDPIGPLCELDAPFPLPTTSTNGIAGTWAGPGVAGGMFNPAGLGGSTVTLSFTPNPGECGTPTTLDISVLTGTVVTPAPLPPLCNSDPPVTLESMPSGVSGSWSGPGVSGNTFSPAGLSGPYTLTFTPDPAECATTASLNVTVIPTTSPSLSSTTLCNSDPPYDLSNLQDPAFPNGTWSGPGVFNGNMFDPTSQSGDVTLTFTPTDPCTLPANTTVTVNPAATPQLDSAAICDDYGPFPLALLEDPNYPDGSWSGPQVNNDTLDPAGLSGDIVLTFTPSTACVATDSTLVTVTPLGTPQLDSAAICEDGGLFPLALLADPNHPDGSWSGPQVNNDTLDPTGLSGPVEVVFTPAEACLLVDTTLVTVFPDTTPVLGTDTLCSGAPPLPLITLADPAFPDGTWSGPGVSNDTLDPAGQSGTLTLTFTPNDSCLQSATTTVTILQEQTPQLSGATLCQNDAPFPLEQLEDPNFPNGSWSGPGVSNDTLDPTGQSGTLTLTFTPDEACVLPAQTSVEVLPAPTPQLDSAALCQSAAPLDLSTLLDPAFPDGSWAGPGVSGDQFDPAGLNGPVTLSFDPDSLCAQSTTTQVEVLLPPSFANLSIVCDPTNTTYTVSFDLVGGDSSSYTVNGTPTGGSFSSPPLPSGSSYSFDIDDGNACGPTSLTGSFNCNCSTSAGSMQQPGAPLQQCINAASFSVVHQGNHNLDPNDTLQFVLHDLPGTQLGTVIAVSDSTTFPLPQPVVLGQTYYVSAIAGNDLGDGTVDTTDLCLSVAPGVPVVFYDLVPQISPGGSICPDDCFDFTLTFSGDNPFLLDYALVAPDTVVTGTLNTLSNVATLTVCPAILGVSAGAIQLVPLAVSDARCQVDTILDAPTRTLTVLPEPSSLLAQTLCPGESLVVNGNTYDQNNPTGTEIFPGAAANGCDSTVVVALDFFPEALGTLDPTLCPGESVVVNGNTYDQNNPAGTEVLPGAAANGCDSIVVVALDFFPEAIGTLDPTLCPGESLVVNGNTYDQSNPSGTEVLVGASGNGCDSTVLIDLRFHPPADSLLQLTLCTGNSITVNGTVYDEANPSGVEILMGASAAGCDSTVTVALSFNDEVVTDLNLSLCPGESVVVNGTVYDQSNPTGSETIVGGSWQGCDSTILVDLSFLQDAAFTLQQSLCPGESVVVNGTVYDQSNPTGTETLVDAAANGCDSIVTVELSFLPEPAGTLDTTLCPGGSLSVQGAVFDEQNPTGTVVFPGAAANGCDSLLTVTLAFHPPAVADLLAELCPGESLVLNGTVYDQNNPSGTEVLAGAAANGCDSILNVQLSFLPEPVAQWTPTVCQGDTVFVNGTPYHEGNPSGTEIIAGGSWQGCDSIVEVSLEVLPLAVLDINQTLLPGDSLLVNGTVYDETNPSGVEVIPKGAANGCDSIIRVDLQFSDFTFEVEGNPPPCFGEETGSIIVTSVSGGQAPYTLLLDGQAVGTFSQPPFVLSNLPAGTYTLELEDAGGLRIERSLELPAPPANTVQLDSLIQLRLGESTTLSPTLNFTPTQFLWEPPDFLDCTDCPAPLVQQPGRTLTYTLTVFDANGCPWSARVTVEVSRKVAVFVPNVFSPDDDGINDRLSLFAGPEITRVRRFLVFSRWGELVFRAENFPPNDPTIGWDGTFLGQDMDPAVFVWFAEVELADGTTERLEGDVVLLRN